jgi:hypothetical protein
MQQHTTHARKGKLQIQAVQVEDQPQVEYFFVNGRLPDDAPVLTIPLVINGETYIYSLTPDFDRAICKAPFRFWLDGSLDGSSENQIPLQVRVLDDGQHIVGYIPMQLQATLSNLLQRSFDDPLVDCSLPLVAEQLREAGAVLELHAAKCATWLREMLA